MSEASLPVITGAPGWRPKTHDETKEDEASGLTRQVFDAGVAE